MNTFYRRERRENTRKERREKKIFLILIIAFALASCHSGSKKISSGFELAGTLSGGGEGVSIYLDRITPDGSTHLDSTTLNKQGNFSFHTSGIYKGFYILRITQSDFATLILDSTEKVHLEGNSQFLGNTYTVSGSEDSKLFWEFNQASKINYAKRDSIQKLFEALINTYKGNKAKVDSLSNSFEKPYNTLLAEQDKYAEQFIKKHPASFACLAVMEQVDADAHFPYYSMVDSALSKNYPNSPYVKLFHDKVTAMQRVVIGVIAPEINFPNPEGKNISLSSFKGKIVLIDFWASWCAPCRETLPGLVKVYDKFKNKNFTIFSVSLDKDKSQWIDAINKFKLAWTQVSELKYWNSKVVKLYNFSSIPLNILVSADGKIIGKNLSEDELESELDSLTRSK